ncbi:MAG: hypothetical protein ACJ72I_01795 [Pseudonocardiaceae bacterium]|jgi:hypothetical protein
MRIPPLANTAIENAGELAVVVPDQDRELSRAVAEVHQEGARLLGNPGAARGRGDSEEVDATGRVLHYEQHVEPLKRSVSTQKMAVTKMPQGLPVQEMPPAWPVAARGGVDASSLQDRPHRICRNLVAEPGEFAVDPSVTPGGVLCGQPQDQSAQLGCCAAAAGSVASRLGPASFHQVPVPPQDRGGGDDPMQSPGLGQ